MGNLPLYLYAYYEYRKPTVTRILKHVPSGGSIVELGSGTGLLLILLSAMGFRTLGIDSSPEVIRLAQDLNSRLDANAKFLEMDLFAAGSVGRFDLSYSEGVIEHFKGDLLDKSINIHKQLGKRVLIVVPCVNPSNEPDQENYSYQKLAKVGKRNGLRPIDQYPIGAGRWATKLLPPFLLNRLGGKTIPCLDVGMVFSPD